MIRSQKQTSTRRISVQDRKSAEHRPVRIRTLMGQTAVQLRALIGSETVSRTFEYEVELISHDHALHPDNLIGKRVTVDIDLPRGGVRHIHGYVWSCSREPDCGRTMRLRAVIVPWLRLLEQSVDCRVFQDTSVPEIVKQVFRLHNFSEFRDALHGHYERRTYCVQYRESALAFVCRLMEEEGISFYFEHSRNRCELVMVDDTPAAPPTAGYECIPYVAPDAINDLQERVWGWTMQSLLKPARFAHTDYDFEQPRKDLLSRAIAPWDPPAVSYEVFDYPGGFTRFGDGEYTSGVRIRELHRDQTILHGRSSARGLCAGHSLRLDNDPFGIHRYLLVRVSLEVHLDQFESGMAPGEDVLVQTGIEAIPLERACCPARQTPRPIVQGPQTAVVVGPSDREIHTDEHGRVKVQFHWDRYGKHDASSSCWVRVSQAWGGKGFGGVTVPRIGQEVIVDFLEGDPDRPIITGRVYNGANRSSLNLPADAMKTCLRTNSLNKTGGYNEIVFDDTSGKEGLHMRSQYDHTYFVGHDRVGEVVNDSMEKVGNNLTQQIVNNAMEQVGVDKMIDVGSNLVINAGTSITLKCGASTIHMNQAGFITISGTVINVAGAANCNMAAPITSVTGGLLMMTNGMLNMVNAGFLGSVNSGGNAAVKAAGDTLVQGAAVKLN